MDQAKLKILMQTTIPHADDDWHVGRFHRLAETLRQAGHEVTTRDLERAETGDDPVLAGLGEAGFDELWLFAVDAGDGLTPAEVDGINAFHRRGGGLITLRDHQDLGCCSLCALDDVGAANFFHTRNLDPDESARVPDDTYTAGISWPNFHSGWNGDFQEAEPTEPLHPLLRRAGSERAVRYFPAHPHEGAVGVPRDARGARVIARGRSSITGRPFNLAVAFEEGESGQGRAVAESSFHHMADYNWDLADGAPSFLTDPPGTGLGEHPERLDDVQVYARNVAAWLAPKEKRRSAEAAGV